ncbi:50S ribosome-binding GTPase, partial [Salmonella enterica subsp. enterica serovar Virginia]|nr:50S ribosome-binding GTPase [Salmonella enterica subsp. enterica serovar Virginia]
LSAGLINGRNVWRADLTEKYAQINALVGKRALWVASSCSLLHSGTTRDVLREHIHIDGMPLHIIDTAGLRDASDEVERIGIERA